MKSIKVKRINFRVTDTEYKQIERKAKIAKMNMSQYVSLQALERDITIFDGLKEHTHQLSKLGTNLNQALILTHQGKLTTIDIKPIKEEIHEIWQLLRLLTEETRRIQG
ncbi:plasmid mobilization relaxosome protein MobC [Clostridiaceae bacterium M8S5]|nr:plasmid mobilization relaxosome protein MobC [Clostridiaceae bacterium M8S5]